MSEKESSTSTVSLPPIGLVARKVGMTRIFTDEGNAIASTVLDVSDNKVAQLRTPKIDGYSAVQTAYGRRRPQRVNKAHAGHLVKHEVDTGGALHEFRVKEAELEKFKPGLTLPVTMFAVGQKVDVTGRSLGKGFAGVIKRHNFSSNRASHGNSVSHNKPGSISMAQDPGRVFPGKKLPGHMGDRRRTVQNLEVLKVDEPRSLLWVKGAVPGFNDGHVLVTLAAKNPL